jgi:3-keto-5-aminohexanoate cleavage enzyme
MGNSKFEERLAKLKDLPDAYTAGKEALFVPKRSWVEQRRWDIPDPFVIKIAPVGGFIMKEDNPHQKYTIEEIRNEILACIEVGACAFHTHVRDEGGGHTMEQDLYHDVIDPIKKKFGENVLVCGCPEGGANLADSLRPVVEFQGILETAPVTVTAVNLSGDYSYMRTSKIVEESVGLIQEVGCKPEIVLHNLGDISMVKRWLVDTKILEKPYYFRLALGNPGWGYIEDPDSLLENVNYMTRELRKIAPDCAIMLDMAGRASLFLVPLAIMLGLIGVRVGMEDAIYMYPHKDEMIKDNVSLVRRTVAMVEALGRTVGTAGDYRKYIGKS